MLPKELPQIEKPKEQQKIPYEIKKLVAENRRASSILQRTHTPHSSRTKNRKNNKLKSKLQEMRNESFKKYVSNLKREDNSNWKTIKKEKTQNTTKICNTSGIIGKKRQGKI
jgi:hypothetical protein